MARDFENEDEAKVRAWIEGNRESIRRLEAELERLSAALELIVLKRAAKQGKSAPPALTPARPPMPSPEPPPPMQE
jgi:hypothetical protein